MGNGTSEPSVQPLDPQLFRGDILINQTFMYDVTIHHTTQKAFSKYRIIRFKQIDRQNEGLMKLKNRPNMQFCLEKHFQLPELLKNASIPARCRHPSILCVQRTISDPINNCLYFVTEPCLPLNVLIKFCSETDVLRGARSMLLALKFVHSSLNSSHNNLRLNSILMNKHIIELLERLYEETDQPVTYAYSRTHPFCYDVYMFSRLFTQIIKEYCSDSMLFIDFLQVLHKSCMHPQPRVRLPPGHLLAHPLFQHPLISSVEFFENYMTYSDSERIHFFRTFNEKIAKHLTDDVLCGTVLPRCFQNNIFLDPPSHGLIAQILHPYDDSQLDDKIPATELDVSHRSCVSYTAFTTYFAPLVLSKFRLHERLTRIILLTNFTGYVHLFQPNDLKDTVLPEVCMGVFDRYDPLSSLSLQAVGMLSSVLGATYTLNALRETENRLRRLNRFSIDAPKHESQLWPRAHLFSEAAPKISRQQRELPLCELSLSATESTGAQRKSLSLAQMAALSANYEPNSNAKLLDDIFIEDGHASRPTSLTGSVIRVSEARYVNASTLMSVNEPPSVDGACAQQSPSPVNHWTSSSSSCPTNSECTPNGNIHYDDGPEPEIDSTKIMKDVQNHTEKTTSGVHGEVSSSQSNRSKYCESDHLTDCVHPAKNFPLNSTDLPSEKPSGLLISPGVHVVKDEAPGNGWEDAWDFDP
ncbi:hypothetical protein EG68_06942 [Paragonimus skrjabini miyazakii]|uniref:Protein kinase domain-containing protein n=1 Tax=Paragonimus skrjabini miyazakii TaxID=59628 RepID=A0A8S9YKG5_9TREM|nr:hypothetical protein EG68_06942 [Paragonimus skrjabini miyazakii]